MRELAASILCAHRGLSHACPENTLPAFGAALALGVAEIEFDVWLSRDGVPVVCHDPRVDRTTDGQGVVTDMDWADVQKLDAGVRLGEVWRGVRMPRMEEVLDVAGTGVGINIHIKNPGPAGRLVGLVRNEIVRRGLLDRAYIAGNEDVLSVAQAMAPDVARCCLGSQKTPDKQVDVAVQFACRRLQFRREVTDAAIARAKASGLICNLFWSDEAGDAREYLRRGIGVILTNRANVLIGG